MASRSRMVSSYSRKLQIFKIVLIIQFHFKYIFLKFEVHCDSGNKEETDQFRVCKILFTYTSPVTTAMLKPNSQFHFYVAIMAWGKMESHLYVSLPRYCMYRNRVPRRLCIREESCFTKVWGLLSCRFLVKTVLQLRASCVISFTCCYLPCSESLSHLFVCLFCFSPAISY